MYLEPTIILRFGLGGWKPKYPKIPKFRTVSPKHQVPWRSMVESAGKRWEPSQKHAESSTSGSQKSRPHTSLRVWIRVHGPDPVCLSSAKKVSVAAIAAIFSSSHHPAMANGLTTQLVGTLAAQILRKARIKCPPSATETPFLPPSCCGCRMVSGTGCFYPSSSFKMYFGWQPAKKAAYLFFTHLWISAIWKKQPCIYFGVMVDHGPLKRKIYTFWDWPVRSRFTIPPPVHHKTTKSWNLLINWGHFWGR